MSTVEIGIGGQLLPNGCLLAVSRQDDGGVGQLADMAQALDNHEHGTTIKVGSADGIVEQGVTRKCHTFFFAIEEHSAARMAWGFDDLELMVSERNDFVARYIMLYGGHVVLKLQTEHGGCLLGQTAHQALVADMHLRLQSESLVDGVVAKMMVEMAVGSQQVLGHQLVVANILNDGLPLFGIIRAAIYDDTLARLIVDNITVLLQHVADKSLDINHSGT